jgi:23S rRNA pseudouridine1911/1915/1917 synthase
MRISQFLAKKYDISRKFAVQMIKTGCVKGAQGVVIKDGTADGDYSAEYRHCITTFDLDEYLVKYCCDKAIAYLYKPPFMHTERLNPSEALSMTDIVKSMDSYKLITRLDYRVDGLVVAVKQGITVTDERKKYLAWVKGDFKNEVSGYWAVDAKKRKKVSVSFHKTEKLHSYMHIIPLVGIKGDTLVEVSLSRAARHQVRAALAYLGYPIIGDTLYGNNDAAYRIMLHCAEISINNSCCVSPYTDIFMRRSNSDI